jgi:subtilase family serine protease
LSGIMETTRKTIARTLIVLLAFMLGVNGFGLYGPKVSADTTVDLIVQDITLSPADPAIGDTVTITITVKNQGTGSAPLNHLDCYMDTTLLDTKSITFINPGAIATVEFQWTATSGSHIVKGTADSTGVIAETDETNNTKIYNFSAMAADLTIQSITWLPQNPSKGDNVVFTVIIKNQGTYRSTLTSVTLYVDDFARDSQSLDIINPGNSVTKTLSWITTLGQHTFKILVDKDNYTKESNETNNEQTFPLSTLSADLIVQNVTWTPQSPSRGDPVTFTATIKNQGGGRSDPCSLGYYIDNVYISAVSVGALAAGASSSKTFTWTALPDAHNLKLVIDSSSQVTESDETNNELTASLTTANPDLIIKDITWTPQNAGVGDLVTFSVIIKNQGSGKALASKADYFIGGIYQGYLSVSALDVGAETTKTFSVTAEFGSISIDVSVDSGNILTESHEENNTSTKTVTIIQPDLTITNISWLPVNPSVGDTVVFTVLLKNLGGGKASNFHVGFYIDNVFAGSDSIYATNGGTTTNMTFEWPAQNGRHIFKAVADYTNHITESNENNNELSGTIIPFMPDLAIGLVTWSPLDVQNGTEVTFDIDIQNLGSLRAGTSRLTFYVDSTAVGFAIIGSLDPGDTVTEHFTWLATASSHTINIVADANNQILEIDEDNNTKVVSLPPPDLVVQSITFSPPDAAISDNVVISASIKNQGSSKTQNSLATLYIDGELFDFSNLPPIDAGGSFEVAFNWITMAGTHTINVTADIDNSVIESDEANNDKEIEFAILTPDLIVQNFHWSTNNELASNEINCTVTVKNIGTGAAGNNQLAYNFEGTPPLTKALQPIPAGQTAELSFTSILSPGTHTAYIIVDSGEDIAELIEDNNDKSFTISTIVPDLVVRTITWSPLDAKIGDTITVTTKVENQGIAKASNLRMSLLVDGVEADFLDIAEIDLDTIGSADFLWKVTAGQHEISVLANSDNSVLESNMSNNLKSRAISFENPTVPVKKSSGLPVVSTTDKGFLNSWWWLLLLIAAVLGVGAFVTALRAARKKS